MKTYNKLLLFTIVAYSITSICIIFGLISEIASKIALISLLLPLFALIWSSYRITRQIKHLNQKIINIQQSYNHLYMPSTSQLSELHTLSTYINELLDQTQSAHQLAIQMQSTTESLSKQNEDLSKKLINKKIIEIANLTEKQQNDISSTSNVISNAAHFNEFMKKMISTSKRKDKIFAMMLLSFYFLDSSKGSNDDLSQSISHEISHILRNDDIIANINNEVVILLNDVGKPKFAGIVAEKIISIIKNNNEMNIYSSPLAVNIGICTYPDDGNAIENLFENASNALYKSMKTQKNGYQFHSESINVETKEYIQLESALKSAIYNHDLTLYYQPQLELKSASITGVEALMRWEHPVLGIINPERFITIAEETGAFMKIAELALMDACQMNKAWQNQGLEHITISVNISPKQFLHPDLPNMVKKTMATTGLNPADLQLEISENIIMMNVGRSEAILSKLMETGVKLSIDHFGVGYTSISLLKKFHINAIKIDKSFIDGIPNNPNDVSITNALIALAKNLGINVIAEGVETVEQVQYLISQNCDMIQGYFLSHPVPASKISSQLKKLNEEVEI